MDEDGTHSQTMGDESTQGAEARTVGDRQSQTPRVVSVIGPTASGKTGFAIALAQALGRRGEDAQIVNADAYQMYRGMDIGTAKATAEERALVRHHLLDIVDPEESMSVAVFQRLARARIGRLREQGVRPILVGGSGLYTRAAIDDISFPDTNANIRRKLEERAAIEGAGALYDELMAKDPQAARHMDPRNPRRTIRALEVIAITGRPYSATLPRYRYVIPAVQIGLDLPREQLDERIDRRTKLMREQGFSDEVRRIRGRLGTTASRALGYQQLIEAQDGGIDEDQAYADIAQRTKRLARKQMGWFGRDPRIHWLPALSADIVDQALHIVNHADAGDYDDADLAADTATVHHLGDIPRVRAGGTDGEQSPAGTH